VATGGGGHRGGSGRGGRNAAGGSGGRGGRRGRRYASPERKKGFFRKLFSVKGMLVSGAVMFLLGSAGVVFAYSMTPIPDANSFATSQSTIVYWNDGETELGRFEAQAREPVELDKIPAFVQQAVIAAEDRSFYENSGFDPIGIARAAYGTVRSGEITGGGSTITQQYVKNYYLTQDQTLSRKVKELFIAVKIDQRFSKDQILVDYLNTIWFGRGELHGVQTAAHSYFGKPVTDLELEEGIALAAFIRNPGLYDPTMGEANEERFAQRFQFVVNGMVEMGSLDAATAAGLEPPEVEPRQTGNRKGGTNGYLIDQVEKEVLDAGISEQELYTGGLRITTTFDRKAQKAAVDAVEQEFPTGEAAEELHAGLAAIRPEADDRRALYSGPALVGQVRKDASARRPHPSPSRRRPSPSPISVADQSVRFWRSRSSTSASARRSVTGAAITLILGTW
jgi:membrane peptidoglycan carboxypeptidase